MIDLHKIDDDNFYEMHALYPGDEAKYWINYNWYWTELAERRSGIHVRFVTLSNDSTVVGFIAMGTHYSDRLLKNKVENSYEIYQLVIDQAFQGKGLGTAATVEAIGFLNGLADCKRIRIAHHPENIGARKLYTKLGFVETSRNYDDDPMMELDIDQFQAPPPVEAQVFSNLLKTNENWASGSIQNQKEFNWEDWEKGLET